jgi:glutamate synthase domain-containing protein 2
MHFIQQLRVSANGKPVGFKLCIGQPENWFALVKAMLETGITPDFIVVDGSEGGTGSAPVEFIDHVGMPMRDALRLIHSTLVGVNLRTQIRLGAAGKIISAFDIIRTCAIGADWCNSARGFMFAIGCIQSRICNTDRCPTGVATQDQQRQKALDPIDKGQRVYSFHQNTLHALANLLAAASLKHTSEITPNLIMRRNDNGHVESFATSLLSIKEGSLLTENTTLIFAKQAPYLADAWLDANAHHW